ncbi:MAG: hypothetical protein SH847_22955 [Roseiflexaceae bacterium]|nr:hypothetical protein [Roseiflexaceae bacterium]
MPGTSSDLIRLGPLDPFPSALPTHPLERRWLHYAFLSRDGSLGMVANLSWLGPDPTAPTEATRRMHILLLHQRGLGWRASQFNAQADEQPWSAFRLPNAFAAPQPFTLRAASDSPFVRYQMLRTSRPCTSQAAPFAGNQHLRWQSEPGVIARGDWGFDDQLIEQVESVGYHERVRGLWGWPEMGGWVFGFANDPTAHGDDPPPTALVFTLIQPPHPADATTGSVMLWRHGRMRRHFPRRCVEVAVRGLLDRDKITQVPELARLFGVAPMAPIPQRLVISARSGDDWVLLDFECETAARIVIPNETGIAPYSVHEVIGPCKIEGRCGSDSFAFSFYGIVEFAGGARAD